MESATGAGLSSSWHEITSVNFFADPSMLIIELMKPLLMLSLLSMLKSILVEYMFFFILYESTGGKCQPLTSQRSTVVAVGLSVFLYLIRKRLLRGCTYRS